MTTRWAVPKEWDGDTVAVLAGGPSLCPEIADQVKGKVRVVAISNVGIPTKDSESGEMLPAIAPWAEALVSSDAKWWNQYKGHWQNFPGRKITVRDAVAYSEIFSLELSHRIPFDPRPTHVVTGGNSGYVGVHVSVQFGARQVLLCGFDMREARHEATGRKRKHYFGNHAGSCNTSMKFDKWIANFRRLAPKMREMGIEIINCTPKSALDMFPNRRLSEVLNGVG